MKVIQKIKNIEVLLRKLLYIMSRRQKVLLVVVMLSTAFSALLQTMAVAVISPLVAAMTNPDSLEDNGFVAAICRVFHLSGFTDIFALICGITIFLYLFKNAFGIFLLWINTKYSNMVSRELSVDVLDGYMHRSYDFFLEYGTTKIMRDVSDDTNSVNTIISGCVNIITESLTVAFILIYIIFADYRIAICIFVLALLSIFLIYRVFRTKTRMNGLRHRDALAVNQKVLLESVEGIKEVQVMRRQKYFLNLYRDTYLAKQIPLLQYQVISQSPTFIIEGLFITGIMLYIMAMVSVNPAYMASFPVLASFMVGAVRMLPSLGRITSQISNLGFYLPSLESVYNNIRSLREHEEDVYQIDLADSNRNIEFRSSLSLEHITWRYHNTDRDVLTDLNMKIMKGESVGIIGSSGAGKSTLADIILGLHIPEIGALKLDGTDIRTIPYEYSRVIGYVPQSIYLVDGSVRANVAFGIDAKDIDDGRVRDALAKAQILDFVDGLSEGMDTVVGERGVRFSGGQRQRIAIARALYRRPQILILDEATSALDNETEAAVMEAIEGLYGTITMVIIAHRLTTVKKCDVLYEIEGGRAVRIDKKEVFGEAG